MEKINYQRKIIDWANVDPRNVLRGNLATHGMLYVNESNIDLCAKAAEAEAKRRKMNK